MRDFDWVKAFALFIGAIAAANILNALITIIAIDRALSFETKGVSTIAFPMLVSSIGLLRKREWGLTWLRVVFICSLFLLLLLSFRRSEILVGILMMLLIAPLIALGDRHLSRMLKAAT